MVPTPTTHYSLVFRVILRASGRPRAYDKMCGNNSMPQPPQLFSLNTHTHASIHIGCRCLLLLRGCCCCCWWWQLNLCQSANARRLPHSKQLTCIRAARISKRQPPRVGGDFARFGFIFVHMRVSECVRVCVTGDGTTALAGTLAHTLETDTRELNGRIIVRKLKRIHRMRNDCSAKCARTHSEARRRCGAKPKIIFTNTPHTHRECTREACIACLVGM